MVHIILSGCAGKMGNVIASIVALRSDCKIVAGVDLVIPKDSAFPVYNDLNNVLEHADVIVDFSHPSALSGILNFAENRKMPTVIATTGLNNEQIALIKETSKEIPVFFTFNMSLGVNLLAELAKKAASVLGDGFDIEIIESHHNQKIDAPSGTALMLAEAITETLDGNYSYEYDRHAKRQKRDKKEIGIHTIRGGTIVGEHEIVFAGRDEIIMLSHSARSKEIFAVGSINAALFLYNKSKGLYNMGDLVASK